MVETLGPVTAIHKGMFRDGSGNPPQAGHIIPGTFIPARSNPFD